MSVHRQFALMLTAEACPTGAVQVAFGVDQDGDADLAPEETALVVGNDCGVWFVRNECEGCGYEVQASTGAVTRVFTAKLDETSGDDGFFYASAWNLAKVTTRGGGEREAGIVAGLQAGGTMMIVK